MNEFQQLMHFFGLDELPEYNILEKLAVLRELKKHEILSITDPNSHTFFFLISGVLRSYSLDEDGQDITDCFVYRYGQACTGFLDLPMDHYPAECVEAITDTQLLCFDAKILGRYISRSLPLANLYNRLLLRSFAEHWQHKNILYRDTAMERYHWFLRTYPGLLELVPHKYVASFLDMTPVTLSRLRRVDKDRGGEKDKRA